ncbi:uridine kinase family protein [Streptomyces cyaneofuscatus]|uniref:uridine kinase family protein n=1 Tax=Streptomyces cyaneofuscatus TaxID=66883 RepID=UPI0033A676BC
MTDLARHADTLRSLPASCGPVRLVAVDGHAGSGKSTFAGRLAEALGGAPVLHLDDLATHEELFGWVGRLRDQVLLPLARGESARYAPYDWTERRFGPARTLEPAPVVLVEGVGAGRREVRPWLAALCWMELEREASWGRGRARDGAGLTEFWDGWTAAEEAHFADDPSRPYADVLVRQSPEGYAWQEGPSSTAGANRFVTDGRQRTPPY